MNRRNFVKTLTALWAGIIAPFAVRGGINQPRSTELAVAYAMRRVMAGDDLRAQIQQGDEITVNLSSEASLTNAVEVRWRGHRLGLPWEDYILTLALRHGVRGGGKVTKFITYASRTGNLEVAVWYYKHPSLDQIGLWNP